MSLENQLYEMLDTNTSVDLERAVLIVSGCETEERIQEYQTKLQTLIQRFQGYSLAFQEIANSPSRSVLPLSPPVLLAKYLWSGKQGQLTNDNYNILHTIDEQLTDSIIRGNCLARTTLYTLLAKRLGIDARVMLEPCHVYTRVNERLHYNIEHMQRNNLVIPDKENIELGEYGIVAAILHYRIKTFLDEREKLKFAILIQKIEPKYGIGHLIQEQKEIVIREYGLNWREDLKKEKEEDLFWQTYEHQRKEKKEALLQRIVAASGLNTLPPPRTAFAYRYEPFLRDLLIKTPEITATSIYRDICATWINDEKPDYTIAEKHAITVIQNRLSDGWLQIDSIKERILMNAVTIFSRIKQFYGLDTGFQDTLTDFYNNQKTNNINEIRKDSGISLLINAASPEECLLYLVEKEIPLYPSANERETYKRYSNEQPLSTLALPKGFPLKPLYDHNICRVGNAVAFLEQDYYRYGITGVFARTRLSELYNALLSSGIEVHNACFLER